jgi:alpha-galactosidase
MTDTSTVSLQRSDSNTLDLTLGSSITIYNFLPAIETPDSSPELESISPLQTNEGFIVKYQGGLGIELTCSAGSKENSAVLSVTLTNDSPAPVSLKLVAPISNGQLEKPSVWDRAMLNGNDMVSHTGLFIAGDKPFLSHSVAGLTDAAATSALTLGFVDLTKALYHFELTCREGDTTSVTATCDREGVPLEPGTSLEISPLHFYWGDSLTEQFDRFARESGELMGARHVSLQTGWCSWYWYYGTENYDDIMGNVKALAASNMAPHLRTIQIDDGWNYVSEDAPRNWGDWHAGYKFPDGMKVTADKIREAGFEPGLWLAPFAVDPGSNLLRDHPDWLIQLPDGAGPQKTWEAYGLDLTNPNALNYVRETFTRVFDEWGFTYIKIDFLLYAILPGGRYDPTKTSAEALRDGLQVIRDVAGDDRFVLTCGCPMGPAVGVADGQRIGFDVSHRWYLPLNLPGWAYGNCNIYAAAKHTIWRQWMHNRWWQNDPDCLMAHDAGSAPEHGLFEREFDQAFATEPPYGLTDEEAACWTRLVWMTGNMMLISEDIRALKPERIGLLERAFPPHKGNARVCDYYVNPDVAILAATKPENMIGVFNLSDDEQQVTIDTDKLPFQPKGKFREWMSDETCELSGNEIVFPGLAPRSGRIWIAG